MNRLRIVPLLLASVCFAQQQDDRISIKDRMWVAAKTYAAIHQYFAHWQGVPDLNFEVAYQHYLEQAAATDDRKAFDLATLGLIAQLRNGHTGFADSWLMMRAQPVGFWLDLTGSKWIVRDPFIEGVHAGDSVIAIDGRPTEEFVAGKMKYVPASDDRARRMRVFTSAPYLWPESFTLTFEGGRTLTINRLAPKWQSLSILGPASPRLPDGVFYHRIPNFGEPKYQQEAVDFLKAHSSARLVILDVRGNGGGSTPERLIEALMDRPYRDWVTSSAMSFGLFSAYGELSKSPLLKDADERTNPIYKGLLYILQDHGCASACEDFVMPLKTSGRATLFGERTFGSSGQPYIFDFHNGMTLLIGAKRMYLPDGGAFEGVGLTPDVEVITPPGAATDVVMEAALKAFAEKTKVDARVPGQLK